jgi:uncharacterized membrane protein YfcA
MLAPSLPSALSRSTPAAFGGGAIIGALGGLIGLGGAEFRLPLLIGAFRFAALEAVILNKAMSLVVVASALPFRTATVPFGTIAAYWPIIVNLLAGSLIGAWFGAGWATRLRSQTLYRVIAVMLALIAAVLVLGHGVHGSGAMLTGVPQVVAGVVAGFGIGIVAALLGVAGGSRDRSFAVLGQNQRFVLVMAAGSIVGSFIGGQLLGLVPTTVLLPLLAAILVISAMKVWRH